jgi:glucose-1-phosphate thymidylyltransferase
MKAVILAAGFATRLYPLTRDRAKPLLEVGGRAVLGHLLDRVLELEEVTEIVIVANARFHADFVDWIATEEIPRPVQLLDDGAMENEGRLGGVADMALGIEEALGDGSEEGILVLAGDNLLTFPLTPFAREFHRLGEPLLLARRLPPERAAARYGEVVLDEAGVVTSFREKPPDPRSEIAATCLYFFPPDIRSHLREYLASKGKVDAPGHFLAWLAPRVRIHARLFEGELFDIGSLESLERARRALSMSPHSPPAPTPRADPPGE